jgi:hypothetical protein
MEKVSKTGDKTPSSKKSFTLPLSFPIALSGVDVAFVVGPISIWRNGELVGTMEEPGPCVIMDSGCEDASVIRVFPFDVSGTTAWVFFYAYPTETVSCNEGAYSLDVAFEVEVRLPSGKILEGRMRRAGFVFENIREKDGSHGGFVIYRVLDEKYRMLDSKTHKEIAILPLETQEVARLLYDQKSHRYKLIKSPGFEETCTDGGVWDTDTVMEKTEKM